MAAHLRLVFRNDSTLLGIYLGMTIAKVMPPRSINLARKVGGVMITDKENGTRRNRSGERGIGLPELLIAFAIIGAISVIALINLKSPQASLRVQHSVRQLASYMEKARIDAVRRHSPTNVYFTSPTA